MDPEQTLEDLVRAINNEWWLEAFDKAEELENWLSQRGYSPTIYEPDTVVLALLKATSKAVLQED